MTTVSSTFDTDADGWTMVGDVASDGWVVTGGDPGGYFQWVDAATGAEGLYNAPAKFLGEKSTFYGGSLSYNLQDTGDNLAGADIVLTGGGVTLYYPTAGTPGITPAWGAFSANLTEVGWTMADGVTAATAQQMQTVLADVTSLEIRAEYVFGPESGGLDNVVMTSAVCFGSGVRLATADGEVAVEALKVGDLVRTTSGALRPIQWIGHRTLDFRLHQHPRSVLPVRVAPHAFGPDRPRRDLVLSPAHSVAVDLLGETLTPIGALVNGATITQTPVDRITYWHVELESHDLVLAENLAAESYLDMGNRSFFAESNLVHLTAASDAPRGEAPVDHSAFCRPFRDRGPVVQALRLLLQERAKALGWSLTASTFAGLHLFVDGVRVEPATRDLVARFFVPRGARDVWLVCDTSRPIEIGAGDDERELGVDLSTLTIVDSIGASRSIELDDARLGEGFHAPEGGHRWTSKRARIPSELFAGLDGAYLQIQLTGPALPRWSPPAGEQVEDANANAHGVKAA